MLLDDVDGSTVGAVHQTDWVHLRVDKQLGRLHGHCLRLLRHADKVHLLGAHYGQGAQTGSSAAETGAGEEATVASSSSSSKA